MSLSQFDLNIFRLGCFITLAFLISEGQLVHAQTEQVPEAEATKPTTNDQTNAVHSDELIAVRSNVSPQEREILDTLDIITNVEFPGNPFKDVVDFLSMMHQFPIVIDWAELEAMGYDDSLEVNLMLEKAQFGNMLTLMLKPLGLSYYIANDVLLITSIEAAEQHTDTRVYNVRPLKVENPEALADVLLYTTGDDSWSHSGGLGELSFFNGSFVIKQNQQTHAEIKAVLNQLAQDVTSSPESPEWPAKTRPAQHPPAKPAKQPKPTPTHPGSAKLNPLPVY